MGYFTNTHNDEHRQYFYGYSTDTRPLSAGRSDKLKEWDTGNEFIWDGTAWIPDTSKIKQLQVGVSALGGVATSGTATTLVDSTKDFEADLLNNGIVKITVGGVDYIRKVTDTAGSTLTFVALDAGVAASAHIVSGEDFDITVVNDPVGILGNAYEITIVEAPGTDDNLSAAFADGLLTIYLGKVGGVLDDTKNAVAAVTTKIDELSGLGATATGSGVVGVTAENIEFSGGVDQTPVAAGSPYSILIM